jgi:hypothetical protein
VDGCEFRCGSTRFAVEFESYFRFLVGCSTRNRNIGATWATICWDEWCGCDESISGPTGVEFARNDGGESTNAANQDAEPTRS